jgi:hypothetical protein
MKRRSPNWHLVSRPGVERTWNITPSVSPLPLSLALSDDIGMNECIRSRGSLVSLFWLFVFKDGAEGFPPLSIVDRCSSFGVALSWWSVGLFSTLRVR